MITKKLPASAANSAVFGKSVFQDTLDVSQWPEIAAALPKALKPRRDPSYRPRAGDVFDVRFIDGATLVRPYGIPLLDPVSAQPKRLVPFSEIHLVEPSLDYLVHFYEHESRIMSIWYDFDRHLPRLREFGGIITPDFSTYRDFPEAVKVYQVFKAFSIGRYCQNLALLAVPSVRLDGLGSVNYALAGITHNSAIAFGTKGCIKNKANRLRFCEGVRLATDIIAPDRILVCGSDAYGVFDYPRSLGIPVTVYPDDTWRRSTERVLI